NAENLLPIPSKCEVTLEDEIECDMPAKDVCFPVFTTFSNPLFKDNDDLNSSDDESLLDEDVPAEELKFYSNPLFDEDVINSDKLDPHCFNVESDFVESLLNHDTFINFSSKFDFSGELAHIKPEIPKSDFDFEEEIRLIKNLLYDNSFPRPPEELNAEIADTVIKSIPLLHIPVQDGNSQQEEIDIVTDDVLPPRDIHFLEELLIDDFILSHESSDFNFEDNPSISRPPPEPPDDNFDLEPKVISAVMEDIDEPNEHFNPGGEIFVSTNNEDVDYFPFMFVILIFLPYLILLEISPLFLSAESEDTIFDPEISNEEIFQAKGDLMKSIQTFLERFNCIPFEEKPQILFQTWETFFAIQCSQPKDSNELFQKLLEDLKELAEYDQSTSTDRPIFLNNNEDHPVQNEESLKNSSEETVVSKTNQEPPQDLDIHQLIEECSIKVPEEQKQKMENTINRAEKSLQNFRVVHKSFISFKNTSQISSIHLIAPIQSTKKPEHLLSMGYEHLSITPETESD
nr:hypothetical protein [Tanacetum cinerariifolium]